MTSRSLSSRVFGADRSGRRTIRPCRLDATRIVSGLWVGSKPETGHAVKEAGFDLLVLCADEYQPPASLFPGVRVIHAPFDDADIGSQPQGEATARSAAQRTADALRTGRKILVTCRKGRNRSCFVAALALVDCEYDPVRAVRLIQSRRPLALSNQSFVDLITKDR